MLRAITNTSIRTESQHYIKTEYHILRRTVLKNKGIGKTVELFGLLIS